MSYCRWSCDNSESDVYVYQAEDDSYSVNIRTHRYVIDDNAPVVIEYDGTNGAEAYASTLAYSRYLRDRPRIPIIKQYAGQRLYFDDIPSTIVFLRQLQLLGYHIPLHAFERLEHDYEEERKAAAAKAA